MIGLERARVNAMVSACQVAPRRPGRVGASARSGSRRAHIVRREAAASAPPTATDRPPGGMGIGSLWGELKEAIAATGRVPVRNTDQGMTALRHANTLVSHAHAEADALWIPTGRR